MRVLYSVLVIGIFFSGTAVAAAQNIGRCQAYWNERNTLLKEYRYCFKSPRAIHYFGNGGCVHTRIENIPFSSVDLERFREIRAMERVQNCSRVTAAGQSRETPFASAR